MPLDSLEVARTHADCGLWMAFVNGKQIGFYVTETGAKKAARRALGGNVRLRWERWIDSGLRYKWKAVIYTEQTK